MSCYYDRDDLNDPENLDWVQIFVASYERAGYPPELRCVIQSIAVSTM
jgi:hypothetical protein